VRQEPHASRVGYGRSVDAIVDADLALVRAMEHLRVAPLDAVMESASAWWVKSLVILAIALIADVARRSRVPLGLLCAGVAYGLSEAAATGLKEVIDRARPSILDASLHPLVAIPQSAAMPSGHATTAFAAAVAVGLVHPRLRVPLVALATLIAISRVYLGVHFASDVIVGALLGTVIAVAVVAVARWLRQGLRGADRPRPLRQP
jgi:membrane-associated phospholipid phosphatase